MFLPSQWKFPPSLMLTRLSMPSYRLIAADTLHDLVTLAFDLLTLVTWSIHPPSLKILTAIRSWVMSSDISHIGYHWQCVCCHCACAVSHDLRVGANFSHTFEIPEPDLPIHYSQSFTTVVLGDHNFPLTASNFGNLTAFRAIFRHIFTAHAQKRLLMKIWLKFWHHHSIPWHQFPYMAHYFGNLRTFSVDFCIG